MPAKRKVPYREVEVTQELTAKPPNWKGIERSIGCTLPKDVRTQLLEATQRFVWFARSEKEAVPLSDVEARLSKVKFAAGRLQSALCEGFDSSGGIAGTHAKLIFKDHFFDRPLPREIEPIKFAIELSTSIIVACDKALKASDAEKGMPADGHMDRAWRDWVQAITRIAKDNKLPTGVRKDAYPGPSSSQFLALCENCRDASPRNIDTETIQMRRWRKPLVVRDGTPTPRSRGH